jgi:hypothetical protein
MYPGKMDDLSGTERVSDSFGSFLYDDTEKSGIFSGTDITR